MASTKVGADPIYIDNKYIHSSWTPTPEMAEAIARDAAWEDLEAQVWTAINDYPSMVIARVSGWTPFLYASSFMMLPDAIDASFKTITVLLTGPSSIRKAWNQTWEDDNRKKTHIDERLAQDEAKRSAAGWIDPKLSSTASVGLTENMKDGVALYISHLYVVAETIAPSAADPSNYAERQARLEAAWDRAVDAAESKFGPTAVEQLFGRDIRAAYFNKGTDQSAAVIALDNIVENGRIDRNGKLVNDDSPVAYAAVTALGVWRRATGRALPAPDRFGQPLGYDHALEATTAPINFDAGLKSMQLYREIVQGHARNMAIGLHAPLPGSHKSNWSLGA